MNNLDRVVTLWRSVKHTREPFYVTVQTAFDRIKSGKDMELVEKTRSNPEIKNKFKEKLPAFSFGGIFKERKDAALVKHSGILTCDFDHCENIDQLRARIQRDKFTFACFLSPGGDGLKVLIKIPPDPQSHKLFARAIQEYYSDEPSLDPIWDLSRLCFSSYDPDIYVNEDSEVWEKVYEEKRPGPVNIVKEALSDNGEIYKNLKVWLADQGIHFVTGSRHKFVFRLTAACNRFGIPLSETIPMLLTDYALAKDFTTEEIEKSAIRTYKNYAHQYNSSHFDNNGIRRDNKRHDITIMPNDFTATEDYEADIIPIDSIRDKMISTYHSGFEMGDSTHFPELDKHFRLMRQHVVVYHGIGNAGKSAFAYQIALMRTIFDDARWAVFSPENHPPTYFYDDLIHMYLGKPSNRRAHNRATEDEYNQGMAFLADKFYYVYPNSENPTPEYIFKVFTHLIKTKKIDGVIIDPYNQMTNELDATGREDRYISQFLGKCKRFAIQHNIYFWIIAHPKGGLKRVKNSQDYDRPNVYDLAGGGMWISKCDDILCVHRKYFYSDPQDTTVEITSQKIKKQKLCGIPGTVEFSFDRQANRFEFAGYNPMSHKTALEEAGITSNDQDAPF